MNKYTVELTPPAVRAYELIHQSASNCIAAGETGGPKVLLLRSVDQVLDEDIAERPFEAGTPLCAELAGVYCATRDKAFVYYEPSRRPLTIAILFISSGPTKASHIERADAILAQILLSSGIQVLAPGMTARLAAN